MSVTGFEKRIAAECPDLTRRQVKNLAGMIAKRAAAMQEEFDFFACLRILGMSSDTTARDAIKNMERAA